MQTITGAALKLCPLDPLEAAEWLRGAVPVGEQVVDAVAGLTRPAADPRHVGRRWSRPGRTPTPLRPEVVPCLRPHPFHVPGAGAQPHRALRLGVAGPVGTGKTSLIGLLCRELGCELSLAVVTNDIYTDEDARMLRAAGVLDPSGSGAVETGACPHTAIRDDVTANLMAVEDLERDFAPLDLVLVESGGDNLTATFSPALVDAQLFVLDVAGGGDVVRKGGPGIARADLLVVNKTDLAPYVGVDAERMAREGREARDGRPVVALSRNDPTSVDTLLGWVRTTLTEFRAERLVPDRPRADGATPPRPRRRTRTPILMARARGMPSLVADPTTRTSRFRVEADAAGRARLHTEHGTIAARQVTASGLDLEAALVATEATLLGGDDVRIDVVVDAGVRLTLRDVAATVAYDGFGRPASWSVSIVVRAGGRLSWLSQPFVVTDGADVQRCLTVELERGAGLRMHDTVVLGRHGQRGGRLRCRTTAAYDGVPLLAEEVTYAGSAPTEVGQAFVRGSHRRIDSTLVLGAAATVEPPRTDTGGTVLALAGPGFLIRSMDG